MYQLNIMYPKCMTATRDWELIEIFYVCYQSLVVNGFWFCSQYVAVLYINFDTKYCKQKGMF